MKKSFRFIMFLFVLFSSALLLSGCFSKTNDDPAPVVPIPDPTLAIKTIMIYLDGDNNLEDAAFEDFNEMEAVNLAGSNVKVIVLFDGASYSSYFTGTRLYEIAYDSGGVNSTIVSTRLSSTELGLSATTNSELNMGDPSTLSNFISFGRNHYQGNYTLILWNHGGGWRNKNIINSNIVDSSSLQADFQNEISNSESLPSKAVCWDETSSNDPLYMNEVQSAVSNKGLSVIGFDACLMGMVEVAYEIRNSASYMIASEESEPGDGWEYNTWLETFRLSSGKTAVQLCNAVVDAYAIRYAGDTTTTLSALDLTKVDAVFTALNSFSQALYTDITTDAIRQNVGNTLFTTTQNYWAGDGYDYNVDLWHFADLIQSTYNYCDIESAELKTAITACVIDEWHNTGRPNSHGLAIHTALKDTDFYMYYAYCYGYPDSYPVDFVQNSSNKWVAHYSGGSIVGPGLLYRILFETLP